MKNYNKALLAAIAALVIGSISMRAGEPATSHDPIVSKTETKATTNDYCRLSDEELIRKAKKLDRTCLEHAERPNTVLSASIQTIMRGGPDDGGMRIVRFTLDPECHVPPCPLFPSQLISEVDFDRRDQVVDIKCFVKD
ncbi:MAG TPA: hypothetical protein VGO45_01895 [Bacteroidia bacterium]|nr:hypothetical protein [Bacteroidia bacterium]